jgi:hypothetical protein
LDASVPSTSSPSTAAMALRCSSSFTPSAPERLSERRQRDRDADGGGVGTKLVQPQSVEVPNT